LGIQSNEARERLFRAYLKNSLNKISNFWLREDKFIGGFTKPSFADLQMFGEFKNLELIDFDFSEWPKVITWMKKIEKIPHYEEVHSVFHQLKPDTKHKL